MCSYIFKDLEVFDVLAGTLRMSPRWDITHPFVEVEGKGYMWVFWDFGYSTVYRKFAHGDVLWVPYLSARYPKVSHFVFVFFVSTSVRVILKICSFYSCLLRPI
jgi:hypothetical protein